MRKIEDIDPGQQKAVESYRSQRLINDILRDELESLAERVELLESESSLPVENQKTIRKTNKSLSLDIPLLWAVSLVALIMIVYHLITSP